MSKHRKASGGPVGAKTAPGEGQGKSPTKMGAVERDQNGRIVSGVLNGGGLTKEDRQARDLLRAWLEGEVMLSTFRASYAAMLAEKNPAIVLDAANRLMGKVKEVVEHRGDKSAPLLSFDQFLQALATKGGNDAG